MKTIAAGLDVLRNHAAVDRARLAAIGYCFGGTTVLEMARSGADRRSWEAMKAFFAE